MKLLYAAFFFLILLFGCCSTLGQEYEDSSETEYVVYETDTYTMECPKDWNIVPSNISLFGEEFSHTQFLSKREDIEDTLLDAMEISSTEKPKSEPMTFDDFEAFEMQMMFEGDEFVMKEPISFAGQDALLLVLHGNIDDDEVIYHVIYFQHEGRLYRIQSAFEKGKEEKYSPIFQRMKDSFELK